MDQNFCFHNANIYSIAEIRTTASTAVFSVTSLYRQRLARREQHWSLRTLHDSYKGAGQSSVPQTQFGAQFGEGRVLLLKQQFIKWVLPQKQLLVFMILILQKSQLKLLERSKLNGIDMYTLIFWKQKTSKDQ